MKKILILLTLLLVGCTSEVNTYTTITQDEAKEMMKEEKDYIILDVRTKEEYYDNHIEDAINIPLDEIETSTLLKDKDQIIFVYCRSGNRSKQASEILANLGYSNIYEIGGINTWEE